MGEVSHLAKHSSRATVACFRKFDRAGDCFRLNMVAGNDVLDGNLDKHHRVFLSAHTPDMYLVAGHLLAFLAQNRDDIHAGAASQADQEHLHRAKTLILSAPIPVRIERDTMAGPALSRETHAPLKRGLRRHYFYHCLLLYSIIRIFVLHYIL